MLDLKLKLAKELLSKEIAKNQGIQEGRHKEALEIAREMKKDKFPIGKIAKLTKLSVSEIQTL